MAVSGFREEEVLETPNRFARKVAKEADLWESCVHTMICLDVLEECGLIEVRRMNGVLRMRLSKQTRSGKVDLNQAPTMRRLRALGAAEEKAQ